MYSISGTEPHGIYSALIARIVQINQSHSGELRCRQLGFPRADDGSRSAEAHPSEGDGAACRKTRSRSRGVNRALQVDAGEEMG